MKLTPSQKLGLERLLKCQSRDAKAGRPIMPRDVTILNPGGVSVTSATMTALMHKGLVTPHSAFNYSLTTIGWSIAVGLPLPAKHYPRDIES